MKREHARALAGLAAGAIFGLGLAISGMTNPQKILGFLDLLGAWDPSLLLVLASALGVTMLGYRLPTATPVLDTRYYVPGNTAVDRKLLMGAAIFGVGWGIAGFCPGPALAGLGSGAPQVYVFVAALLVGAFVAAWVEARQKRVATRG
jgi:uncharacterized membrane protein YedE/YeeE